MASTSTTSAFHAPLDLLAYLPFSGTKGFQKGETIYDPNRPSKSIYVVATGKVEILHGAENGSDLLLEILRPDELFGESAFLGLPHCCESATVLESATLMSWTVSQLEDLIMKQPRVSIALLQVLTQRNAELIRRIESFSLDKVERRLARSLIPCGQRIKRLGSRT